MESLQTLTLLFHSVIRYFVLIALVVTIFRSAIGVILGNPYTRVDDKISIWLLIMAHTQLLLGLFLYFISPVVVFSGESMKNPEARYWLVEHITLMIISVALITFSRVSTKNLKVAFNKHKGIVIFNGIAFLLIIIAIGLSGRGYFQLP